MRAQWGTINEILNTKMKPKSFPNEFLVHRSLTSDATTVKHKCNLFFKEIWPALEDNMYEFVPI